MPSVPSLGTVTIPVNAGDLVDVVPPTDWSVVRFENPPGSVPTVFTGSKSFGPFTASGAVKLTSDYGDFNYALSNQGTPFVPANASSLAASTGSSLIGFIQSGTGAVARTSQDKQREWVSVTDFAADGVSGVKVDPTGVVDSTLGWKAALATGADVIVPHGTYKLTSNIAVANNSHQKLIGLGEAILSVQLAASTDLFTISGPLALHNLTVDFNNGPCRYAFDYAQSVGNIVVRDLRLRNLKDMDSTNSTQLVHIPAHGNTFNIQNVTANTIKKKGNGVITDSGGTGATQGSIRDVFITELHNIDAGGSTIYEDTTGVYVTTDDSDDANNIVIDNVHGDNFGKRLIKVQASNVHVSNAEGYSDAGDSLSVVMFGTVTGAAKKNTTLINGHAKGKIQIAFATDHASIFRNIHADTVSDTSLQTNATAELCTLGDGAVVDGAYVHCPYGISIGNSSGIARSLTFRNIRMLLDSASVAGIRSSSATLGYDGLTFDGLHITIDALMPNTCIPFDLTTYLNGTTKVGANLSMRRTRITGPMASTTYGLYVSYCASVLVDDYLFENTGANTAWRTGQFISCSDVTVRHVRMKGAHTIGPNLNNCTGRNLLSDITSDTSTTVAYNTGSTGTTIEHCDYAKIGYTVPTFVFPPLRGSATYDPPSIANAASTSTAVTVTGAAKGDIATAGFTEDLQGLKLSAYVSANDTATVKLVNDTGSAIDLASGTLTVHVSKP